MAAVCKWPLAIQANMCTELFVQSSLQFAFVCFTDVTCHINETTRHDAVVCSQDTAMVAVVGE